MLKKARAAMADDDTATDSPSKPRDTSQQVLDSSRSIWLAGLGAFSRAQAEGMRVFEGLVKQGEALESKTRRAAADTAAVATDVAKAKVKEMKDGVGGTWDKLEQVFEARVARALSRLGVHTQNDVERLTERVDALSAAVNALIKSNGASAKAAPGKKSPAGRAARKPAAAAKSPAKRAARRKAAP